MIGLSQEELDQFIEDYMEEWREAKGPISELTETIMIVAMQHASRLIVANNERIEEDLKRLGLNG